MNTLSCFQSTDGWAASPSHALIHCPWRPSTQSATAPTSIFWSWKQTELRAPLSTDPSGDLRPGCITCRAKSTWKWPWRHRSQAHEASMLLRQPFPWKHPEETGLGHITTEAQMGDCREPSRESFLHSPSKHSKSVFPPSWAKEVQQEGLPCRSSS